MSTDESYEKALEELYNEKDFQSELFGLCKGIDEDSLDWILPEHRRSCWVEVDSLSVYIVRTDEGVVVSIYKNEDEMDEELASTYAFFQEAEEED